MRNFKELKIWQLGMDIAVECYKLCADFPQSEKYGLTSQMTRAAVSIPSNIAEGCSRSSQKEYLRFIDISLGSCYELETQAMLAKSFGFGNPGLLDQVVVHLESIQKMLFSFRARLNSSQ